MRHEDELLLACSRSDLNAGQMEAIVRLVDQGVNWGSLFQAAVDHKVLPLLWRSLKTSCPTLLPPQFSKQVQDFSRLNSVRCLRITAALVKISRLFGAAHIQVVGLKGPVLSQLLYGDMARRTYNDLDILVYRHDVTQAMEILIGHGYMPEIELAATALPFYMEHEDDLTFVDKSTGIVVELHWEITGRYLGKAIGLADVQGEVQGITVGGVEILSLGREDLLLCLCIHGAKHMWERLEWLCCVAEFVRQNPDLDWQTILARAGQWRCRRMLLLGLLLAHELLQAPMPTQILAATSMDSRVQPLADQIKARLFPDVNAATGTAKHGWRFSPFHVLVRDSWAAGGHFGLRLLFGPTIKEWQRWPLPGYLSFLYYGFRPLRLIWDYFHQKHGKL